MRTKQARPARTGKHGKRPRIAIVAPERFREARMTCFLSVDAAAKLLHVTRRTLHNWEAGTTRIPYAAFKLMRIMRGGELPGAGDAWAGWHFAWNEVLISPEGHRFKPGEFAWLHVLIEQAKFWRKSRQEHYAKAVAESLVRRAAESAFGFPLAPTIFGGVASGYVSDEPNPYLTPDAAALVPAANRGLKVLKWRQNDGTLVAYCHQDVQP